MSKTHIKARFLLKVLQQYFTSQPILISLAKIATMRYTLLLLMLLSGLSLFAQTTDEEEKEKKVTLRDYIIPEDSEVDHLFINYSQRQPVRVKWIAINDSTYNLEYHSIAEGAEKYMYTHRVRITDTEYRLLGYVEKERFRKKNALMVVYPQDSTVKEIWTEADPDFTNQKWDYEVARIDTFHTDNYTTVDALVVKRKPKAGEASEIETYVYIKDIGLYLVRRGTNPTRQRTSPY